MKSKKLILMLAVFLLIGLLLASCTSKERVALKDVIDTTAEFSEEKKTLTTVKHLSDFDGYRLEMNTDRLAVFSRVAETVKLENASMISLKEYILYDLIVEKEIMRYTDTRESSAAFFGKSAGIMEKHVFIVMTVTDWSLDSFGARKDESGTRTVLFDKNGEVFAEASGSFTSSFSDLITIGEKSYRVDSEGGLSFVFEGEMPVVRGRFNSEGDGDQFAFYNKRIGDRYYSYVEESNENSDENDELKGVLRVYDLEMNEIVRYEIPSDRDLFCYIVLENGNVFLQLLKEESDDAEDHSFVSGVTIQNDELYCNNVEANKKYTLDTLILSIDDGSTKSIACDYLVGYGLNLLWEDPDGFAKGWNTKDMPVRCIGYPIKNKEIDVTADHYRLLIVNDDGELSEFEDIDGGQIFGVQMVGEDRWVVNCCTNVGHVASFLVDEKCEVIGEVTRMNLAEDGGQFFYDDEYIYDMDLDIIFKLGYEGMTLKHSGGEKLIISGKDGELYFLDTDGKLTEIKIEGTPKNAYYYEKAGIYYISNDEKVKNLYDAEGNLLFSTTKWVLKYDLMNGFVFLTVDPNDLSEYYILTE